MKRLLVLLIKKKKGIRNKDKRVRGWRKCQMSETVLKHSAEMGKLIDRIKWLENSLLNKDQEISRRDYLATKELPVLPKKQKESRLCKLKKLVLVSKAKEISDFYFSKK